MKNSIATALVNNYGFEIIRKSTLFAGRGSWFSAGQTIEITFNGDFAHIAHRKWLWNCDGECVYDTTTTTTCRLSEVWGFLPEWVLSKG
jgi:hypothetical protein